jgi:tetratricopeptide (TPR) repeat protein
MSLGARVRASDHAQRLRDRVEEGAADRPAELAGVAVEMVMTGESAERAAELAERAIERLQLAPAPVGDYTVLQAARALVAAGKLKAAERTLTDILEDGRRRGAYFLASVAVAFRAEARYHAGSLAGAEADARDALAFYEEAWPTGVPGVTSTLVRTLLDLGRRDEADAAIAQADLWGPPGSFPDDYTCNVLLFSRGELYLARQEWQLALDDLTESGRRQEAMGEHNPALVPWRSTAARALAELGRRDEALALANEELKLSRAFGAPRPLGLSLRTAALLEDSDRRLELLREAVEVLNTAGAQVEHARSLAELGATLRAQGREDAALEALRASLYLSQESGAAPIEDQANDELRVSGARR